MSKLPKSLQENSGIASYEEGTAWFVEDRGNTDNIYKVNFNGELLKELDVKGAKNRDWEDLTQDKEGNLYIGDFGNNGNQRKDLAIYKLPNPENEPGDKIDAEEIFFNYPNQKDYPPHKKDRNYDAEAFFHHEGYLYIFTKSRAEPFSGTSFVYRVPDTASTYEAELVGQIKTCADWDTCQITSADIAPNGNRIVLLGYGKLWILSDFSFDNFSKATLDEIDLGVRTQLESVCFKGTDTLLLSDEESGQEGRNLYTFKLN